MNIKVHGLTTKQPKSYQTENLFDSYFKKYFQLFFFNIFQFLKMLKTLGIITTKRTQRMTSPTLYS